MKYFIAGFGIWVLIVSAAFSDGDSLWHIDPSDVDVAQNPATEIIGAEPLAQTSITLSPGIARAMPGQEFVIPLPDGNVLSAFVQSNYVSRLGGRGLLLGTDMNGSEGALLYFGLNSTLGYVWSSNGAYEIRRDSRGQFAMNLIEDGVIGNDRIAFPEVNLAATYSDRPDRPLSDDSTLDFLFMYDIGYLNRRRVGFLDAAAFDMAILQATFNFSNVPIEVSIADFQFMDITVSQTSESILRDAVLNQSQLAGVRERVSALDIDLISLRRNGVAGRDSACGYSSIDDPTQDMQGRYHIVNCDSSFTLLTHHVGHNLGLSHGLFVDGPDGPTGIPVPWARGYHIGDKPGQSEISNTIMVGLTPASLRFSDPTTPCPERGSFCGVPIGEPDAANAAQALRDYGIGFPTQGTPERRLRSALLPTSRRVLVGDPATAFMTVVNVADVEGINCQIQQHGFFREQFTYQTTDPTTNAATGSVNSPVNIPPGGSQTFVISIVPPSGITFDAVLAPMASCENIPVADVVSGLNTMNLDTRTTSQGDFVALAATIENSGIAEIPDGRRGVFSVATVNLGATQTVHLRAVSVDPLLPATGQLCQTNPGGACLSPPTDTLTVEIGAGETPTFGVFVSTAYSTPFAPRRRFQFQISDNADFSTVVGSTSIAVRDLAPLAPPSMSDQSFTVPSEGNRSVTALLEIEGYYDRLEIVSPPTLGTLTPNLVPAPLGSDATNLFAYAAAPQAGTDQFTYRAGNSSGYSEIRTATIEVAAIPAPNASEIEIEDDVGFGRALDLDDHSSGEIDRFALVSSPSNLQSFDPISGYMEFQALQEPQEVEFTFQAVGPSESSPVRMGRFNVVELTNCVRRDMTSDRIVRRVERFELDGSGVPTINEAALLGEFLCFEESSRSDPIIVFFNADGSVRLSIVPVQAENNNGRPAYSLQFQNVRGDFWLVTGVLCMSADLTRLERC